MGILGDILERLIARYLKPYFDGLDGTSISVFSGKMTFADLKIKPDFCQTLGINTAEVINGGIKNLVIQVPMQFVTTGKVSVTCDYIYVNLKSLNQSNSNSTDEELICELREGKEKNIANRELQFGSLREQREDNNQGGFFSGD